MSATDGPEAATLATNEDGDLVETGVNTTTGRVFIKNRATSQRVDFAPEMALAVAIAMSEYVTNDDDRGFVRHQWGDLELDWDDEDGDGR
jgi:hypothetical protein